MTDIELPGPSDPPTLADQLRGALYEGAMYHRVTKISHEHRVSYLVPEHLWNARQGLTTPGAAPAQ